MRSPDRRRKRKSHFSYVIMLLRFISQTQYKLTNISLQI